MKTELLGHIIHMYISIRGFGISKTWMEEYKVAVTTTTKKKSSAQATETLNI